MSRRELLKRIEKLEQHAKQIAKERSRSSPDCICFPDNEKPFFGFPLEGDIAFAVKCPLHGDRFKWPIFFIYVAKWRREKEVRRRQGLSAQFQKAWEASFPSDLWPAQEEKAEEGTYLRLRDGTRLLVHEFAWKKKPASRPLVQTSGSSEKTEITSTNGFAPGLDAGL